MPQRLRKIPAYTRDDLLHHSRIREAVLFCNRRLGVFHRHMPRPNTAMSDMRRWIMLNGTVFIHFSHRLNPSLPPLTASQLNKLIAPNNIANYSSVSTFLKNMVKSGHIEPLPGKDQRIRPLRLSTFSERMCCFYANIYLRALDILDNGGRHMIAEDAPSLLISMQPAFSRTMLREPLYQNPPPSLVPLATTSVGALILGALTQTALVPLGGQQSRIRINPEPLPVLATRYQIPLTALSGLLSAMERDGNYGHDSRGAWISRRLLDDQNLWHAAKLAAFSDAFIAGYKTTVPAAAYLTR